MLQRLKSNKELPKLVSVTLDQGLMSLTTLLTTVVLARVFDKNNYAEIVLLFTLAIFFLGFQSALISKPFAINLNDFDRDHNTAYFNFNLRLKVNFTFAIILLFPVFYSFSFEEWDFNQLSLFLLYITSHSTYFFVRELMLSQRKTIQNLKYGIFCCISLIFLLIYIYLKQIKEPYFFLITASSIYLTLSAIYLFYNYRRTKINKLGFRYFWNSNWSIGKWLVGSNILFHISSNIYPWLLLYITSNEDIAVFGVLMSVAGLINPILTSLSSYLLPVFVKLNDDYLIINKKVNKWVLLFIGLSIVLIVVGYLLGQNIITSLFGDKYSSLGLLTFYPFLVQAITVLFQPFKIALNAVKRTDVNFKVLIPRSIIAISLGYTLISYFGLYGVFYTMLIENFLYQLTYFILYKKIIQKKLDVTK